MPRPVVPSVWHSPCSVCKVWMPLAVDLFAFKWFCFISCKVEKGLVKLHQLVKTTLPSHLNRCLLIPASANVAQALFPPLQGMTGGKRCHRAARQTVLAVVLPVGQRRVVARCTAPGCCSQASQAISLLTILSSRTEVSRSGTAGELKC